MTDSFCQINDVKTLKESSMTIPRPVKPRQWGALMLTTVALTHATALPAQTAVPSVTTTPGIEGGEGGEGGESGAAQSTTDAQSNLNTLAKVDGYLRAGVEVYRQGHVDKAASLVAEARKKISDDLGADSDTDVMTPTDGLTKAITDAEPVADVEAAYATAQTAIAEAMAHHAVSAKGQLTAVYELLTAAAEEYDDSVTDGKIVNPIAWEEAHGFTLVAADIARRLADGGVTPAAETALAAIQPALDAFVYVDAAPQLLDAALLPAAAAQVEFAALTVK
ncbi:hypothetical protein [Loktanella atrilutea]|nr:hypothetical protein [Loktanella atrilutea]